MKKAASIVLALLVLLAAVFCIGRYGWRRSGFDACDEAGIDGVTVTDGQVRITGFYPGSFPRGFVGAYTEEKNGVLYVGVHFSAVFGLFEPGDFDITIATKGTIRQVVLRSANGERILWTQEQEQPQPTERQDSDQRGIFITLDRRDVYAVGWYFENVSGGMSNADGTPLDCGTALFLDSGIDASARNLERPVPVMIDVRGTNGETIAQGNYVYDPRVPLLSLTLTAEGKLLPEGGEKPIPQAYSDVIARYAAALQEGWEDQRLLDEGLCVLAGALTMEEIGYAVVDLDGNGEAELVIGTITEDPFYGRMIFDLYTLDGDNAELLAQSVERDRWYYAGGIRFANLGSSGAGDSFETTRKLEGQELVDMTFTTDPQDYVQLVLTPFQR